MQMKIGIIGMGNVGSALGGGWIKAGHEVQFGVRQPEAVAVPAGGKATSVADAAKFAEVVVLAIPWEAVKEALQAAGDLKGKIVFDCTNPIKPGLAGLAVGLTTSAGEQVAALAPGAMVVKIFNTTGSNNMADPLYGSERASMFFATDHGEARKTAASLAKDLGFEPVDAGPLENARLLEPMAMLWIYMAVKGGYGRDIAFRLLRR
jgi:predicted dinucleotide-binding enzyme